MRFPNAWTLVGLLAVCMFPTAACAQLRDTIITQRPHEGTITRTTPNAVTMEINGAPTDFPVPEIRMLRYAEEPTELENAKRRLMEDNVNAAKSELQKIALGNIKQDTIKMEVEYYIAYCNARLALDGEYADKNGAGAALKKFVDNPSNPKYTQTYHFYEAARLMGDLSMSVGQFDYAEQVYSLLERAPGSWTEHRFQAKLLVANAQLARGDYKKALGNYEAFSRAQPTKETARYFQMAKVGQAVCLAGDGRPDEGIAIVEEIIKKEDPKDTELFGKAYNALGACYLQKQKKETDPRKKASLEKQALMAFLRTDILFWQDAATHAEALFHLSQLWASTQKPERANKARATLRDRYSGTRWSQQL